MSWWETLHLVTWWKRLGISAIKTGQDAPSWIWCTERLSFFWGGHIVLQRFVHVRCHFQPLPTKLVFAYFDRGSYIKMYILILQSTFRCAYIFNETYVQISGGRATGETPHVLRILSTIWEMRSLQRWDGTSISTSTVFCSTNSAAWLL